MSGKRHGSFKIGGDDKTRKLMNLNNPRGNKRGGRKSNIRGRNTDWRINGMMLYSTLRKDYQKPK